MVALNEQTRMKAFAQREHAAQEDDPEITANAIDFSKPLDSQDNLDAQQEDVKKGLMTFPAPCPQCFNPG